MTSLVSASQVVTGQVQSLDSVRAHALPSDAMIFASGTKVQPANQNPGSYNLVESANALTLTTTGSVPVVTQSPFADLYKEGSLYFNGTVGNYVSATATGLSTTQWNTTGLTVEAWVNYTTFAGAASQSGSSNQPNLLGFGGFSWQFGSNISGNASFYYWTNGTTPVTYMATTPLSTNTWNHITFTCTSSGTGYMFINGVQSQILTNTNGTISGPASTVSITGTPTLSGSTLYLNQNIGGTAGVSGYVADVRVVTGAALYTSGFTVPSAPLSTSATGVTQFLLRAGQNSPTIQSGALTFDRGLKQFMNFGPLTFNAATQGFCAIFKFKLTGVISDFEYLWNMTGGTPRFAFLRLASTNTWYAVYRGSAGPEVSTGTVTIPQNTTAVIAVNYNPFVGTNGTLSIWLNGVSVSSVAMGSSTPTDFTATSGTLIGNIGTETFSANIFAFYNRSLSNVEIYNSFLALNTNTVNAPIEIGDVNGTPALSIAGDGRVNVTKLGQTSNVLPWPPAAMTGYVTSINGQNYVASASNELSSSYVAWFAFDKTVNLSNQWASPVAYNTSSPYNYTGTVTTTDVNGSVYSGEWLQIQLPSSILLSSYTIAPSPGSASTQGPQKFNVLGSRDGVNWFLVDSRSGITNWANGVTQTFSLASSPSQAFSYYRIITTVLNGGQVVAIAEWTLYGTADTAQPLTVAQPVTLSYGAQTASLTGIAGDRFVPQDFSSSGLNIPAYVVSNTATVANTVAFSSFGPFAGEGSVYFPCPYTTTLNQCGAYINFGTSTPPNFTPVSTPFTIEGWVYVLGAPGDVSYYTFLEHGSPNSGAGSAYDMASYVYNNLFYLTIGGVSPSSVSASGLVYNAWNHVSGCWNGTNTIYASVNGTVVSQAVTGTPTFNSAYSFLVGAQGGAYNMRGYIACARVIRGLALYTASFTPPTAPLQPIQGTTQAGLPYGTVLLLRNAPAPGRVLTQKFAGINSFTGPAGSTSSANSLAFPPAAMTGYSTSLSSGYGQGTYVASASVERTGTAWNVFNKNFSISNFWQVNPFPTTTNTVDVNGNVYNGDWVQLQMPVSIVLSSYLINGTNSNQPAAWTILGSRDGTNWYLVNSQTYNIPSTSNVTFQVSSSQAFSYFRYVYQASQGTYPVVCQLVFNGTIEGPVISQDGRLGLGVSAPTQTLEVAGNSIVYGRVGVGTTNPPYPLSVYAPGSSSTIPGQFLTPNLTTGGAYSGIVIGTSYASYQSGLLAFFNNGSNSSNVVSVGMVGGMAIYSTITGIGINTASPGYPLDVNTGGNTAFRLQSGAGVGANPVGMLISCYNDSTKDCGIRNNNAQLDFLSSSANGTGVFNFYSGASGAYTTRLAGFSAAITGGATTLSVDANGYIIRTPSDERLKSNIQGITYGLDTVNTLRPVCYEWKDPETYGSGRQLGMIAQEVQQIVPECVSGGVTLSLDYQKLVPVLTKAIQELSARVASLEQQLASTQ
jgi:hypothetical protein